jgi:hypothetical protein
MTTMRRIMGLALLVLLMAAGAGAQPTLGQGGGLWSSGPPSGLQAADIATSLSLPTTGTVIQTLHSWTIPAGSLLSRPGFKHTAWATTAANGNAKVLWVKLGSTFICGRTVTNASDHVACDTECFVASSTSLACRTMTGNSSSPTGDAQNLNIVTGLNFAAAIPLQVQSTTATAAGDLTLVLSTAYFFRP